MELLKPIKAIVTSKKWKDGTWENKTIEIPKYLSKDFVKFGYGYLVQEEAEEITTPESKEKRTRKTK